MNILYENSFAKDLKVVNDRKLLQRIKVILKEIKEAKNIEEIKNIKKLKSSKTHFRIRVGNYRIGLEFVNNSIILTRFQHRKDIYRYFPPN